jgi:hypothetical protein
VTTYRGWETCTCVAAWLAVFDQLATAKEFIGGPNAKILQLTGSNPASAGTHAEGGAFDLGYYSGTQARNLVWLARQMGADATWYRAWDNNHHVHGILRGCPHNGPARYQIDAVDDGYDGLGYMGREGPDDGPRPLTYRTYTKGIDWAGDSQAADGTSTAGTFMVRMNPGTKGFNGAVRDAVWEHASHTVFNEDPVSMKNLLRYGHGEATNSHKFAKAASTDIDALQAKPPPEGPTYEGLVGFAALIGVLGVVLGAALTLALVALL